ncbi:helix-turn-helix transcriptional regulator [Nocardioides sp. 31GB23]|uniref:helix-turn-helix domain-containing protein n=1 Tax=Nocardioides sp. 31GB23 TaxID=3156065 RepID=UPI0032AFB159
MKGPEHYTVDAEHQRLATFVHERRSTLGMTQTGLAAQMKARGHESWRQSTVFKIENGQRRLLLVEGDALARALGLNLAELLTQQGPKWGVKNAYVCATCTFASRDLTEIAAHAGSHSGAA